MIRKITNTPNCPGSELMYQAGSKQQNSRTSTRRKSKVKGKVRHENVSTKTQLRNHKISRQTVRPNVKVPALVVFVAVQQEMGNTTEELGYVIYSGEGALW